MELTCALVLLVQISFVISSPYGYGPRAGASAKAEASAAAGALPIDVPRGAGYSGSFSKSYSSNSAASSASSSASSSSFSFSGTGSGGSSPHGGETGCGSGDCKFGVKGSTGSQGAFSGNNAASLSGQGAIGTAGYNNDVIGGSTSEPKTSDCGSGNCQLTGVKNSGYQGSTGSSNAYSGANALGSAGAGLQSGSTYSKDNNNKPGCEGPHCESPSGSDSKCSSGQCGPNGNYDANVKCSSGNCGALPQVGPSVSYGTESKCTSGQCGPNNQPGSPSIEYNSNDIQVPASATGVSNAKTNYGSYGQDSATNSNTGCKYGNCGLQPASNPSYTPEYPPCSSPDCNNYGQGPSSTPGSQVYNKPSTLLTTPREDTECTSPNCQTTHNKPPSVNSYPVPNYGTPVQNSFTNPSTTPCIGGNCNYGQTNAPHSTNSVTNLLSSQQPSQIPNSPSNCASGNCNFNTSPQGPAGYGGYSSNKPPYLHGSAAPLSPLPPSGYSCVPGSLNCNAGALDIPPGSSCLPSSPTCHDNFAPAPKPGPLLPLPPASSCSGPTDVPCNDAFVAKPKPGSLTPFQSGPNCAPGSPNCNAGPSTGYYDSIPKPGPLAPIPPNSRPYASSPSHSFQPDGTATIPPGPIGGSYSVTGSLPSSPHASSVGYQPGLTSSGSYTSAPTIPSYNLPSNGLPAGQTGIATPSYSTPSGGCKTPNCAGSGIESFGATAGANAQTKPVGANTSNNELPHYDGGFGGPSGILKPNEFKAPSSPFAPSTSSNTPSTSNPDSCATGNCVQPPISPSYGTSFGPLATAETGANTGFGGPAGVLKPNEFTVPSSTNNKPAISGISENKPACSTGNCGQQDTSPHSHGSSGAQSAAVASASANAVAYTGGFGGPPGFLKPFDGGKADPTAVKLQGQNEPHQGTYSNNGVGSHQGSYPNNGLGSHQGSYTNNGVRSQSTSGIQASSLAQANSVAGAASGTNGVGNNNNGGYGHKAGCGGGCGAPNSGSYGGAPSGGSYGGNRGGANFGENGGLEGLHAAGASAKSLASAVGGSGGYGGSYASSSATAHAASGAAIKGSYGK